MRGFTDWGPADGNHASLERTAEARRQRELELQEMFQRVRQNLQDLTQPQGPHSTPEPAPSHSRNHQGRDSASRRRTPSSGRQPTPTSKSKIDHTHQPAADAAHTPQMGPRRKSVQTPLVTNMALLSGQQQSAQSASPSGVTEEPQPQEPVVVERVYYRYPDGTVEDAETFAKRYANLDPIAMAQLGQDSMFITVEDPLATQYSANQYASPQVGSDSWSTPTQGTGIRRPSPVKSKPTSSHPFLASPSPHSSAVPKPAAQRSRTAHRESSSAQPAACGIPSPEPVPHPSVQPRQFSNVRQMSPARSKPTTPRKQQAHRPLTDHSASALMNAANAVLNGQSQLPPPLDLQESCEGASKLDPKPISPGRAARKPRSTSCSRSPEFNGRLHNQMRSPAADRPTSQRSHSAGPSIRPWDHTAHPSDLNPGDDQANLGDHPPSRVHQPAHAGPSVFDVLYQRSIQKNMMRKEVEAAAERLRKQQEAMAVKEQCTFKPKINRLPGDSPDPGTVFDRFVSDCRRRQRQKDHALQQASTREIIGCTFKPKVEAHPEISDQLKVPVVERLVEDAKQRKKKMDIQEKKGRKVTRMPTPLTKEQEERLLERFSRDLRYRQRKIQEDEEREARLIREQSSGTRSRDPEAARRATQRLYEDRDHQRSMYQLQKRAEQMFQEECTFKPKVVDRKTSPSNSDKHSPRYDDEFDGEEFDDQNIRDLSVSAQQLYQTVSNPSPTRSKGDADSEELSLDSSEDEMRS